MLLGPFLLRQLLLQLAIALLQLAIAPLQLRHLLPQLLNSAHSKLRRAVTSLAQLLPDWGLGRVLKSCGESQPTQAGGV